MTTASPTLDLSAVQHLTLSNVPWAFYEHVLSVIGNGQTRVTFCDGSIEIMSPLPKHERWGALIARLLELMALERGIYMESLGSTTFRSEAEQKGFEPDECFFIRHAAEASKMDAAWDADRDPPPDLAVEIDITRRSIAREPIYAALRVPEVWRFDGQRLTVHLLGADGTYADADKSGVFPFLPMNEMGHYLARLATEPQLAVLRDFRDWVRTL